MSANSEQLRSAVRLLFPSEMTPTAYHLLLKIADEWEGPEVKVVPVRRSAITNRYFTRDKDGDAS